MHGQIECRGRGSRDLSIERPRLLLRTGQQPRRPKGGSCCLSASQTKSDQVSLHQLSEGKCADKNLNQCDVLFYNPCSHNSGKEARCQPSQPQTTRIKNVDKSNRTDMRPSFKIGIFNPVGNQRLSHDIPCSAD